MSDQIEQTTEDLTVTIVLEGGVVQAAIASNAAKLRALGVSIQVIDYEVDRGDANALIPQGDGYEEPAWVYGMSISDSEIDLDGIKDLDDEDEA